MFSKFIWNLNIINVEDAEVFELYYKFVQAIYIEEFYKHSRIFGIQDIIEFIIMHYLTSHQIEKIEPKNQMCCQEHFPNEVDSNNLPELDNKSSSFTSGDISRSLYLSSSSSSQKQKQKFITKYDKKLSVLMNLIEKVLYASKGDLAGDIYHLIKCLTLNLTPCFYRNLLKLMIVNSIELTTERLIYIFFKYKNLLESDDKEKRTFLKKFFEYSGVYSVLFTLSRCTCPVVKTLCVKLLSEIARMEFVQMNSGSFFRGSLDYEDELSALISYSLQFTFLAERPQGSLRGCKIYEDFEIIDSVDNYEPQILIQNNHFDAFKQKNNEPIKELEDSQMSSFEIQKDNKEEVPSNQQFSENLKTLEDEEDTQMEMDPNGQQLSNKQGIQQNNFPSTGRPSFSEQRGNAANQNINIPPIKLEENVGSLSSQIKFHPLYVSIIEWVLNREASSQLKDVIMIDDKDQIQSIQAFLLLIQFFDLCDDSLQQYIIVDIYFLIRSSVLNRQIFIESKEFQNWVIKILFRSLSEQMSKHSTECKQKLKLFENQWNMAIKILSTSYSHGLTTMPSFGENLNELVGLIKNVTNNATGYQFQIVEYVGKLLLRLIFQSILENIIDDIKNQGEFSKTHLQKNMKWFINLTFNFIFSESYQIQNPPIEFDFYLQNSSHFTYLEDEYLNLPAFPRTFGSCVWIDAPLIFRIMESYSNLFSKYCINNDLLFNFFTIEQSLHMDNLYQILFAKQSIISSSSHPFRKFSNNATNDGDIFGALQNGLMQSATFQNKLSPQDEEYPFVQQLFFMESSLAEFFLKSFYCSEEQLNQVFTFLENMIKVSAICCENSRQIQKTEEEITQIKNFFIFGLSFYYNMYRHLQKENNESLPLIEESIRKIMHTLILVMDKSCKIPGYSKIIIQIFQNHLFDQNNNPLLTESIIKKYTFDNMNELDELIFTDEWQYAFIDNFQLSFPDSAKIRQQFEYVRNQESTNIQFAFEKVMKKRKDLRTRFDDNKYSLITINNTRDQLRKTYFLDKDERLVRQAKSLWHNIWKKNRTFCGLWKHPNFNTQIDQLFSAEMYEYQKMEQPTIFYYKMSKYMTKQKVRPLLKVKLVEPKYVIEYEKKKLDKQLLRRKLKLLQLDIDNPQTPTSLNVASNTQQKQKKTGFNLLKQIKNIYQSKNQKDEVDWFVVKCQWIKSLTIRIGMVKLDSQYISFYFDTIEQKETHLAMVNHSIPDNRPLNKSWPLSMVKYYMRKRFVQRKTAIEFFMYDGSTVLLNFPDKDHEAVIEKLQSIRKKELHNKPNFGLVEKVRVLDKQKQIKKWIARQKSNLDYLMILNFISGRSYRDLTQYPVVPWIWTKYDNKSMNLNDASIYRNFSKTMGALGNAERTEQFRQKLETTDHFNPVPPYNFGTHYSSPAIIFQFLLRIKPYNTGAWYLQAQRFDIPDRLFFSLFETFKNVTEEMSDVRELIPEFYYLPELFLNLEKHDFGLMQSKERVHNVQLPPWCEQNPYKFVVTHRLGLESDIVSRNIHQWIDLIFGCKSRGKEAELNINKFYYLTYEDEFHIDEVVDEKERIGYESQIIHFGQCPTQLLTTPHPQRIQNQVQPSTNASLVTTTQSNVSSTNQTLVSQSQNVNPQSTFNPAAVALNQQLFVDKTTQLQFFRSIPIDLKDKNIKEEKKHLPESFKFQNLRSRTIIQIQYLEQTKFLALRKNGEVSVIKLMPAAGDEKNYPFKQNVVSDRQLELDLSKVDKIHHLDLSCQFKIPPTIFLNQGKYLLTGGLWGGKMNLYNIETEKLLKEFKQIHNWTVTAMDFDQKSNILVTGSKAGDICIIKMSSDYQTFVDFDQFYDHKAEVTAVHINYEFRCVATASVDGTINVYNIFNKRLQRQYNHPKYLPINKVQISTRPLYAVVFFSETDCTFYSYSINGQLLATYSEDSSSILNPLIIQDSSLLDQFVYINYQTQKLKILELPYLTERFSSNKTIPNAVWWQPSFDKKYILCAAEDGSVFFIIDPKSLEANLYKTLNQYI